MNGSKVWRGHAIPPHPKRQDFVGTFVSVYVGVSVGVPLGVLLGVIDVVGVRVVSGVDVSEGDSVEIVGVSVGVGVSSGGIVGKSVGVGVSSGGIVGKSVGVGVSSGGVVGDSVGMGVSSGGIVGVSVGVGVSSGGSVGVGRVGFVEAPLPPPQHGLQRHCGHFGQQGACGKHSVMFASPLTQYTILQGP